jgi:Zn-dependent protease with chaperone function
MDFYARQAVARRASRLWLAAFIAAVVIVVVALTWIVLLFSPATRGAAPAQGLGFVAQIGESPGVALQAALFWLFVIAAASAWRALDLRDGGGAVATALGGARVDRDTRDPRLRRLHNIVEEMSIASGVTMPEVYVLEREGGINAFAAGQNPANAAVAVTRGAVERLNREQLQGVIAHEFSHILNGDMRLNVRMIGWLFGLTFIALAGRAILRLGSDGGRRGRGRGAGWLYVVALAMVVIGWLGALAGRILQAAVCRRREHLADASAVQFTRNPEGLKGALLKIAGLDRHGRLAAARAPEVAHMLFVSGIDRVFATHPPLAERVRALDPTFDTTALERLGQRAIADTTPDSDLEQLTSRMHETRFAVEPAVVAAAVGRVESRDIVEAARLRMMLPDRLHDFAESTGLARSLVLELLLSRDESVRSTQRALIAAHRPGPQPSPDLGGAAAAPAGGPHSAESFAATLDPHLRLPALLQLFPALRALPRDERLAMLRLCRELARADSRIEVHEFCLLKLLADSLRDELEGGAPHGGESLAGAADDLGTLFSVVATQGAPTALEARRAYEAGIARVLPRHRPPLRSVADWPPVLDAACTRLAKLHPYAKRVVVEGLVATISHDGEMTLTEVDLLRTLCAILQLPLPALLGGAEGEAPAAAAAGS